MVNGPNGWKMNKIRSARSYAGIFLLLGSLHNFCWCKNANNIYFTFYFSPIYLPVQKDFIYQLFNESRPHQNHGQFVRRRLHLKLYKSSYRKIFVEFYIVESLCKALYMYIIISGYLIVFICRNGQKKNRVSIFLYR